MTKKHAVIRDNGFIYYSESKGLISIKSDTRRYSEMLGALLADDFSESAFLKLIAKCLATDLESVSDGKLTKVDNTLEARVDSEVLVMPMDIHTTVQRLLQDGAEYQHLENFWRKCLKNPNRGSIEQLYRFITHNQLTITEDGCFIAYKAVRSDYLDKHSGQFDNHPGNTLTMPRDAVTFDPEAACSAGLHVGALEYAKWFSDSAGDRIVAVKVDPANVVSVPFESSSQKIRVCEYTVIQDWESPEVCQSAVVDDDLNSCTSFQVSSDRPWSNEEVDIIQMAMSNATETAFTDTMQSLAVRLGRTSDEVRQQAIKAAPWAFVGSRNVDFEVRRRLWFLYTERGKHWEAIKNIMYFENVIPAEMPVDTLRKICKRMEEIANG